jgi:hypothetical protein
VVFLVVRKNTTTVIRDGEPVVYTARKRKYRFNCCACGGKLENAPTTWAFCSKGCEKSKREPVESSEMTFDDAGSYLLMARSRETLPEYLKSDASNKMEDMIPEEPPTPAKVISERPSKADADFWLPSVNREFEKFDSALQKTMRAGRKLGLVLLDAKSYMRSEDEWLQLCGEVPGNLADGAMSIAFKPPEGFMNEVWRLFQK